MRYFEIFNEATIFLCYGSSFFFTGIFKSYKLKQIVGWVVVGLIGCNILLSSVLLIGQSFIDLIFLIRKIYRYIRNKILEFSEFIAKILEEKR